MRNNWGYLLLLALSSVVPAGCTVDGPEPAERGGAIDFYIGFAAGGATRVSTDAEFKCRWEDGDTIGVYVAEHGTGAGASGNYIDSVKLSYSGGVWTASKQLFWPEDGGKLDFYAYYPYTGDSVFDPVALDLTVEADQSGDGFRASYLMTAKNDGESAGLTEGATVTLAFEHALAMVQLTLDASMIPNPSGVPPVVTLRGMTSGITMHGEAGDLPGVYVNRALVPPQIIAGGVRMFRVDMEEWAFVSEPIAGSVELGAGEAETFGLSLSLANDDYNYAEEITDPTFESICLGDFDGNSDGELSYDEMMAVDYVSAGMWGIESLEGIRYFKNLRTLECEMNNIEKLDLTGLTSLRELSCYENKLTELDLSGLTALEFLGCDYNPIDTLDVSGNRALEAIYCGDGGENPLTVVVDPDRILGAGVTGWLYIGAVPPGGGQPVTVTQKGVPVHGVTVIDKQ